MLKTRLTLLFSFFASIVIAQQHQYLTLDDAIRLGLENSKSYKISQAKIDAAHAKYNQAVDAALPSVSASASYQRLSDLEPPTIQFPGVAEPIVIFPIYVNNYSTRVLANEIIFSGFRAK